MADRLAKYKRRSPICAAFRRVDEFTGAIGAEMFFDANHVRNDLAGFFNDDCVADADVLAGDFFDVVQTDAADRCAGDLHRLEVGGGR
jgi:hypothetical protein